MSQNSIVRINDERPRSIVDMTNPKRTQKSIVAAARPDTEARTKKLSSIVRTIAVSLNKVQSWNKIQVGCVSQSDCSPNSKDRAVPRFRSERKRNSQGIRQRGGGGERRMGSGTSTVRMKVFGNADGTRYHPHSRRRDASYLARWKLVSIVCSGNSWLDLLALGILLASCPTCLSSLFLHVSRGKKPSSL
ncbi:hypothetical protein K0M31_007513 [Melipona bicolor]|uniref:Uncharacterized protein n=1 Tax=Melipona bicolor TaxID=60889 RepID=A0AA40GBM5_9HYME|nr:hypothetical protein K0M31_007513 [Melipona bicolor]